MKFLLTFFTFISFLTSCNVADTSQESDLIQNVSEIETIAQYIEALNQTIDDTLIIENFDDQFESCNGAELIGYYQNKKLVLCHLSVGMSFGIKDYHFFYKNDSLIFVNEILNGYQLTADGGMNYDSFDIHFDGKYYFQNDSLIDLISLGHNRFEDDSIDIQKTLLEEAYKYQAIVEQQSNP